MADDFDKEFQEEMKRFAMRMDSEKFPDFFKDTSDYSSSRRETKVVSSSNDDTTFSVNTPIGVINVDFEKYELARKKARQTVSPPQTSLGRQMTIEFLDGNEFHDHDFGHTI